MDFTKLNDATIKDAQPLPRIDDTLDALHGSKWFITLDLKVRYWQDPITEQHKEKTAFRTSSGKLMEFNVMPFGLCNDPATFSRLMDTVLSGLAWDICLAYLDDIIIFARTWQEHLHRLRLVLQQLREAKLTLHPGKCTLAAHQVAFLGHQVSQEGLRPDPALVQTLQHLAPPVNQTEVRQFLGLASYYRRFVPGFAKIAALLNALLKKEEPFAWNEESQLAFQQLKDKLAARLGLGAILAQVQDGRERIIHSASHSLYTAEKNYCATKCLAIYWGICSFRHFLLCMPFEVFTDHYSLKGLRSMKSENAVLHRWAAYLEEFNFTVIHRPGKKQAHVDALSHLPLENAEQQEEPVKIAKLEKPHVTPEEARKILQDLHGQAHLGHRNTLTVFRPVPVSGGQQTVSRDSATVSWMPGWE